MTAAEQEAIQGPKPIAISISTDDIQALYACKTDPHQFNQLILAKLKDAGAPVEGVLDLRLAHGRVCKMKDNPMEEQKEFTYMWLSDAYVHAIATAGRA